MFSRKRNKMNILMEKYFNSTLYTVFENSKHSAEMGYNDKFNFKHIL